MKEKYLNSIKNAIYNNFSADYAKELCIVLDYQEEENRLLRKDNQRLVDKLTMTSDVETKGILTLCKIKKEEDK